MRKFAAAKTPIKEVREQLAAAKAKRADDVEIDATAPRAAAANASLWDEAAASANKQFGFTPKK